MFYIFFFIINKMNEQADLTYYQKNQDLILNRAKNYYENDKKD